MKTTMLQLMITTVLVMVIGATAALAYEIGDVVEDFTLTDLNEEVVSLSDEAGQIIVLNFFTTWCLGCNEEAAHLEADIWQGYADENVTVIAIDIQEQLSLVQGWALAMGVTYPIWLTPDWDLFQLFPDAMALPYNAILDGNLEIRYAAMGFDLQALTDMIDFLLEEQGVPVTQSTLGEVKAMYRP